MQITGVKNIKYGTVKTLQTGYDKVECAPNLELTLDSTSNVAVFDLCSGLIRAAANTNQKIFVENSPGLRIENANGLAKTYRNGIPIGGYWNTDSDDNPADLFGGYWSKSLSPGRCLVSAGTGFTVGTEGGSPDSVIVAHTHKTYADGTNLNSNDTDPISAYAQTGATDLPYALRNAGTIYKWQGTTNSAGESGVGKNMPPYHATNIWKRIVDPAGTGLE